jgi:DNA-binding NarL/FixJ family response regulator
LEVLVDVKHNYARMPVVMVSVQPEEQYSARCLRAGAAAYINKDSAPEELAQVIMNILDADRGVSGACVN